MIDLDKLIKAYDIRGTVPDQFNEDLARQIGAAFVRLVNDTVIVVRDMRPSSVPLATAFTEGVTSQGHNVIDVGLGSTDLLYFASGWLNLPGAVFTASHNPAQYNGIKLCKAGARPVGQDTGLGDIRRMLETGIPSGNGRAGTVTAQDMLAEYTGYLRDQVDLSGIRRLGVAVDAANGMDVLRVGRVVSQPRGEPARSGEPGGSTEGGRAGRRGHRPCLRRGRRPLFRGG